MAYLQIVLVLVVRGAAKMRSYSSRGSVLESLRMTAEYEDDDELPCKT